MIDDVRAITIADVEEKLLRARHSLGRRQLSSIPNNIKVILPARHESILHTSFFSHLVDWACHKRKEWVSLSSWTLSNW